MLKDTLKEIMGSPKGLTKESEKSGKGEMAKILFSSGKSRNGMRNDMMFVQVKKSYA